MFDPTVFDNLKVVIEGAFYDLDLEGEYTVYDRHDIIDLATMKRAYEISLRNNNHHNKLYGVTFQLYMDISNLSAELLNIEGTNPGCAVKITFSLQVTNINKCSQIKMIMAEIWGTDRQIEQVISFHYPEQPNTTYHVDVNISFNRTITEDQIDDIIEMIAYITKTLDRLNQSVE